MTTPSIPLDVRVEFYDSADRLVVALIRDDLIFAAAPRAGDTMNPVALAAPGTGSFFDTTPQVHHFEHYPTLKNGRALGTLALAGDHAYDPGGCVVVHQRHFGRFTEDSLERFRDAGWHVSDFQDQVEAP